TAFLFGNQPASAGPTPVPPHIPVIGVIASSHTADIPTNGFTVTIMNFGGRDLTAKEVGTITIGLVVNGKAVGSKQNVPALKAGATTPITFPPFPLPSGSLKIGFDLYSCHSGVGCQGGR